MSTIVKIQKQALAHADATPQMLVANQSCSIQYYADMPNDVMRLMGNHDRVYAKAKYHKSGRLEIKGLVANQGW